MRDWVIYICLYIWWPKYSCEELTHWKRLWCWEGLGAGGEGDDRGWDGWMASLTRLTWVWVNSGSWWWTRRPGVLWFIGLQRVGHDWATELNWTFLCVYVYVCIHILFIHSSVDRHLFLCLIYCQELNLVMFSNELSAIACLFSVTGFHLSFPTFIRQLLVAFLQ